MTTKNIGEPQTFTPSAMPIPTMDSEVAREDKCMPEVLVEKPDDLTPASALPEMKASLEYKTQQEETTSEKSDLRSDSSEDLQPLSATPTTPYISEQNHDDTNIELLEKGFIQLNTHDVSLADQHVRVEKFARHLQSGVDALWSSRNYPRYKEVRVLLMSWKDDNLGVKEELLRLKHVFSHLYRYDFQSFEIPDQSPARITISKVSSLIEDCGVDTLVIIYYGGHAALSRQRNGPAIWAATDKPGSVKFSSFGVQQVLEEAPSDVLLLYDCCYASHPAVNSAGQGVTEVIAACGFETQAPAVGPHSFTNALIQELEESFNGLPFYAAELHSRILGSLKNWKPQLLRDHDGIIWTDENHQPKYECHKRRTPIHCLLTTERPSRSILLAPLLPNNAQGGVARNSEAPSNLTRPAGKTTINLLTPKTSKKELQRTSQYPEVLISVRLEEDYLADDDDAEDEAKQHPWREWFRNIPNAANKVTIHGVYKSFSTLLVMSMPIALWNILPNNAAYSFIGFVNSDNLAPQQSPLPGKVKVTDHVKPPTGSQVPEQERVSTEQLEDDIPTLSSADRSGKPLRFLDPNGHKFLFPLSMCKTWKDMKGLIHEALEMDEDLLSYVEKDRYRLFDLNETVILPRLWESFIRPGMNITMRVWPSCGQAPSPRLHVPNPMCGCSTCTRNVNDMRTYAPFAPPHSSHYASYANDFAPPPELHRSISRESIQPMGFPTRLSDSYSRARDKEPPRHSKYPTVHIHHDTESDTDDKWSDPEECKRRFEKKSKVEDRASKFPAKPNLYVKRGKLGIGKSI